jgi:polysaccharide biosynthesis/export protein
VLNDIRLRRFLDPMPIRRLCVVGVTGFVLGCAVLAGCASRSPGQDAILARGSAAQSAAVDEQDLFPTKDLFQTAADPGGVASLESPVEAETGDGAVSGEAGELAADAGSVLSGERTANPWSDGYRIAPGDVLDFMSFDTPEISRQVVVRFDGGVSLPLIPDVNVYGVTRDEATELVREAYAVVYKAPQISLTVADTASRVFYVLGDVMAPRQYPYTTELSVVESINIAGGTRATSSSNDAFDPAQGTLTKAFIIRHYGEERDVIECDLRNMTHPGAHPSDTPVFPGDIVYVPQGVNLVYVLGEVGRPTVFQLAEGQTLVQLLASAGSVTESTGRMRHVVLLREIDSENTRVMVVNLRKILRTGDDIVLEPGDVIYVPRKPFVRLQEFVNRFTGSVSPLLNLYNLAWDTGYTKKRLETLYDQGGGAGDVESLLNTLRTYQGVVGDFSASIPQPPALP